MSKVNILNLILFIAVISLGFVIYHSEKENTNLDLLTNIDANDINSIIIRHNTNRTTLAKDSADHWRITQPISVDVNNFRISSLLKLLYAPVHSQYSVNEFDLSSIGLDAAKTSVTFDDITINFGISNPTTSLRYIRIGDSIYTIQDAFYPLISSDIGTLVSFNLLPNNSHIEKLVLKNQTISKDENGRWQSNIEISADNINKTLEHWQQDQAFGVHKYLPRKNLGEVFVYLMNNTKPIVFSITDDDPWLILARTDLGIEYHLDVKAYNNLIVPTK